MQWPLIGRERELAQIASAERGVVLVAEAGVGKSRLAREAAGPRAHWVQATRSAATVPLAAFAALLPDGGDDVLALMRQIAAALGEEAVLVVDDAHLLDHVSAALVLELVTTGSARVIATVRAGEPAPDAIVSIWKDAGAVRMELAPLRGEQVRALVEAALADPVQEAALRWVVETAHGNALYVRELVTGAVESGALLHADGFWRLAGVPSTGASLVDLVSERLAGADETAELLALGEPLPLSAFSDEAALVRAEAAGWITLRGQEITLAHPLYGEVLRARIPPLRARGLRLRLASLLTDPLRVATLLLDAGATLDPGLALAAAKAANRAGDPDLAAQLAELAPPGLETAMTLAQAHLLRNRYAEAEAELSEVEALAEGDSDYLRRRVSNLAWGVQRRADALALLARAEGRWNEVLITRLRHGLDVYAAPDAVPADLAGEPRGMLAAQRAIATLLAGRGDEAAILVRDFAPPVPFRHLGDSLMLAARALVCLESGHAWNELERFCAGVVRDGVRANDHDAAGLSALTLARLAFLRGRYRDAARWSAEAEVHLTVRDAFGALINLRALEVGIAAFEGDYEGATARLVGLRTLIDGRELTPMQSVFVARAEGWALRLRSRSEAAKALLTASQAMESPVLAAQLAYEALRAGARVEFAGGETRLVRAYAAHAGARDGAAMVAAAETFAEIGAARYAVEAFCDAGAAFVREGRSDSARRAAVRARELFSGEGEEPVIDGLDAVAVELTARETQIVGLVAQGLSNAEVAERLVLSVRTVETHVYRALQKLGLNDRRELRTPAANT